MSGASEIEELQPGESALYILRGAEDGGRRRGSRGESFASCSCCFELEDLNILMEEGMEC